MNTWQKLRNDKKLWNRYFIREKVVSACRSFLTGKGFHEVETPLLVPCVIPESYLEQFETHLLDRHRKVRKMFLTTSPEASLKKLLVAGIGNCFEITKSFRNTETDSKLHNPEFTILEYYRVNATYKDIMKDCEKLIAFIYQSLKHDLHNYHTTVYGSYYKKNYESMVLQYQGKAIDLTAPWQRISVIEAVKLYANIDFDEIAIVEKNGQAQFLLDNLSNIAQKKGYKIQTENSWEEIFNQIFLNEVEPHLGTHGKPTIIYDYPQPMAALATLKKDDPRLAERFEFYIARLELGDCYNELQNAQEQKKRFQQEVKSIAQKGKTTVSPDWDFINALEEGLPKSSGIAIGLDRLAMLLADTTSIADVLLFPYNEM